MEQKFRHELKHFINLSDYYALKSRLSAVTEPDPHAGLDGAYKIRSLYFDNLQDKALREKIDGVDRREKFRIRYYDDDLSCVKLEKKCKIRGLCEKKSALISKAQCEVLLEGDIRFLKESSEPLFGELYAKMRYQQLRPKTLVDYIREPFLYRPGNVRITIDRDIHTGLASKDLFNPMLPTIAAGTTGTMILEVKYDEFLPGIIADILQVGNRQASAFSKYAVCRIYG